MLLLKILLVEPLQFYSNVICLGGEVAVHQWQARPRLDSRRRHTFNSQIDMKTVTKPPEQGVEDYRSQ
jgi:hypothetical protein